MLHDNESADVITRSVGVVVITSALHAVGHGFETHTEYFSSNESEIKKTHSNTEEIILYEIAKM